MHLYCQLASNHKDLKNRGSQKKRDKLWGGGCFKSHQHLPIRLSLISKLSKQKTASYFGSFIMTFLFVEGFFQLKSEVGSGNLGDVSGNEKFKNAGGRLVKRASQNQMSEDETGEKNELVKEPV